VLLAEDLLILLVKRATGDPPRRGGTQALLAAAVLMELAMAGRLGVDRDGAGRLHVFVERGVLTARSRMGIWRVADRARREHLRGWLAGVLLGRTAPDRGSAALISLLHMVYATSVVVGGSVAVARATAITDGDWPAGEVTEAIAEDCADIVNRWTSEGGGPMPV